MISASKYSLVQTTGQIKLHTAVKQKLWRKIMNAAYLFVHKDHKMDVRGVNSGAETATIALARSLAKVGKRVIVCAQLVDGEEVVDGVEYWDLGPDYDVVSAIKRAGQMGTYHLISSGRAFPIMLAHHDSNCLTKLLISHDPSGNDTGLKHPILSRLVDRIICVSHAQKTLLLKEDCNPEKVSVIHNGVDLDIFRAGDSDKRDYMKLVFSGALIYDKGIHLLLNSYAQLKAKYPELSLDVFGAASLWDREKMFDEQEVEKNLPGVKFHGKVQQSKIAEALTTAGIAVVPSVWFDSFPLSSLEAQVTGCPVVAFDVGGLPEGIWDGETGVIIKEIEQEALTRALDELLSNPKKLKKMSECALVKARQYFTWTRVVKEIVAHCNDTVEVKDATQAVEVVIVEANQDLNTETKITQSNQTQWPSLEGLDETEVSLQEQVVRTYVATHPSDYSAKDYLVKCLVEQGRDHEAVILVEHMQTIKS